MHGVADDVISYSHARTLSNAREGLEISDIENVLTPQFRGIVRQSLADGTAGKGRGFVLMPSSCPYGRRLPDLTQCNYEAIIEEVEALI